MTYKTYIQTSHQGSAYITLYKEFLKTLPNGTYTLEVTFADGTTTRVGSAPFTIQQTVTPALAPTETKPPVEKTATKTSLLPVTGDHSNRVLWMTLLLISLGGIGVLTWKRNKHK